jgi:hypothetical protein
MQNETQNYLKEELKNFWNSQTCGTATIDKEKFTLEYFEEIEEHRYDLQPEIFNFAQFTRFHNKRLLEVGVGAGTDFLQWVRAGEIGDGTRAIANAWEEFSDVNLKRNLIKLTNASQLLKNINAYYYFWKSGSDNTRQFGLIAQEVEEVLPEIVSTNVNGIKTLDYSKVSALLIEAVKDNKLQSIGFKIKFNF